MSDVLAMLIAQSEGRGPLEAARKNAAAAGDAAGDAAWDAVTPTKIKLQKSALKLVERMCALSSVSS